MIPSWLLLWATFQVGFVPLDTTSPVSNMEYVEPGFGVTIAKLVTLEGSIRTYVDAGQFFQNNWSFTSLRDTYTFRIRADPLPWLEVGFLHWCSHADAPFGEVRWRGDFGSHEFYAKVRVGP